MKKILIILGIAVVLFIILINLPAPVSVPVSTEKYFGNEVKGDLNADDREDRAYIITDEPGGSGTFYYVMASINMTNGEVKTNKVLLGDRIAPQPMSIEKGILIVNYADRRLEDSFVVPPSVGKTLYLKLDPQTLQFGEVR